MNTELIGFHAVKKILAAPLDREWSLQGLGMLRTYLDEERTVRLHVWAESIKFENVSELHTHPWDMTSRIIAGHLMQERYVPAIDAELTHMMQKILCGEGGGLCGAPVQVGLRQMYPEHYSEDDEYKQQWWEIHRSLPVDGTVTLVTREFTSDPDHAYVFFPIGQEWVTAEPRQATEEEVLAITENALNAWF